VACELVFYRLNVHRLDDASPALRRYKDAVAWLREVAAGRAVLVGAVAPATQPPAGGMAEVVQAGRKVFGGGLG
jgi:phage gp36-like protein